jgi:hypothetical protein
MAIYHDPDTGQAIATHSMLKTFRRCPKQTQYKYVMRLKPKHPSKPLERGTWIHKLLEVYYRERMKNGDVAARIAMLKEHQRLSLKFNELFDEEKDELGDLPREIMRIMEGYFWHYKNHDWKVHDVEFTLETTLPDGSLYRCKLDLLVEDQYGLWIVDHKSHVRLPDLSYRILDSQSALYVWCAIRNGIPVQGHIWNYVRAKVPTVPAVVAGGTRLSRRSIETDYLTLGRTIKRAGLRLSDYGPQLKQLKKYQYVHGEPQLSPFFRRDVLEKTPELLQRVAQAGYHTARRMNDYPWDRPDLIERNVERSCTFSCSYVNICTAELWGGNITPLIRQGYTVGDPLEYYNDDRGEFDKANRD